MKLSDSAYEMIQFIKDEHMKDAFGNLDMFQSILDESSLTTAADYVVPLDCLNDCAIEEIKGEQGTRCFVVSPAQYDVTSDLVLIYYHGGGFVMEIAPMHWEFVTALVNELGCRAVVPLYETLPVYGWKEAYRALEDAYLLAGSLTSFDNVVPIGESAGGYLALATQHLALLRGWELPGRVVALSPLTDIALEIPLDEKNAREDIDLVISMVGAVEAVRLWAPDAQDAPAFPPCILHAPFEGLAPTLVITGSDEVLLPDSYAWVNAAEEAGAHVTFIIGEGLWHAYPTSLQVEEAQEALARIIDFIKE